MKMKYLTAVVIAAWICAQRGHAMTGGLCQTADSAVVAAVADSVAEHDANAERAAMLSGTPDTLGAGSVDNFDDEKIFGSQTSDKIPSFDLYTKILDKSHRYMGDKFSNGFLDHLGLTLGAGVEQVVKPNNNYALTPLTIVNIGLTKDFSPYHSLRLLYTFGFGYQKGKDLSFKESMGSLDYIFNLSSYFGGYRPDRRLSLSPFVGVGMQNARLGHPVGVAECAVEAHAGLQFKFFAGHKATFSIEPMVKIASDKYDISGTHNWRRYDVVYGGNMLFTYYFRSMLSQRSQSGDFRHRYDRNALYTDVNGKRVKLSGHDLYEAKARLISDSVFIANENRRRVYQDEAELHSWRTPVFFDFSGGVSMVKNETFSSSETMGTSLAVSMGKWFSSFIGIRATGHVANGKWGEAYEAATTLTPSYKSNLYATYAGGELESMFNLLGLRRNYNWASPAGFTLLAGVGYGRMMKYDDTRLECDYVSYKAGAQVWMRLSDDLRLFVEPCYTYYSYKIPYTNVKWNKKFGDKELAVRMGVSVLMNSARSGEDAGKSSRDDDTDRFVVGLGGGVNQLFRKSQYQFNGGNSINFNAAAYGYYMFNRTHGAQLNVQFVSNAENMKTAYQDFNPDYNLAVERTGLWKRTFYVLVPSFDYKLSLTELLSGHSPHRRCDLDLLVGPAVALRMGETDKFSSLEHATGGNQRLVKDVKSFDSFFGANMGFNLKCRATERIGVFAMPMFYYFGSQDVFCQESLAFKKTVLFTFNVGVQLKL